MKLETWLDDIATMSAFCVAGLIGTGASFIRLPMYLDGIEAMLAIGPQSRGFKEPARIKELCA